MRLVCDQRELRTLSEDACLWVLHGCSYWEGLTTGDIIDRYENACRSQLTRIGYGEAALRRLRLENPHDERIVGIEQAHASLRSHIEDLRRLSKTEKIKFWMEY